MKKLTTSCILHKNVVSNYLEYMIVIESGKEIFVIIIKTLKVMKKTINYLVMVALATVLGFSSCSKDKESEDSEVSVNGRVSASLSVQPDGGSYDMVVTSNTSWAVEVNAPGITVTPMHGEGTETIRIVARENTSGTDRSGSITITSLDGKSMAYISLYQESGSGYGGSDNEVAGSYVGKLKPIGYSDSPARAYVTLQRLSSDAVRMTSFVCETFGLDMNPVNLRVTRDTKGKYTLESETNKVIQGTYYKGELNLTFANSLATFSFSGSKE